jgi:hypothetical protein
MFSSVKGVYRTEWKRASEEGNYLTQIPPPKTREAMNRSCQNRVKMLLLVNYFEYLAILPYPTPVAPNADDSADSSPPPSLGPSQTKRLSLRYTESMTSIVVETPPAAAPWARHGRSTPV